MQSICVSKALSSGPAQDMDYPVQSLKFELCNCLNQTMEMMYVLPFNSTQLVSL